MPNKPSVAAVVVTYNRKVLLKECLDALLAQTRPLDSIIVVDNASTDGTREFLEHQGYLSKPVLDYIHLRENTGGAGGFHYGVKRGFEQGFDWLWIMDDDAEPKNDSLAILISSIKPINDPKLGALAQTVLDINGEISYHHRGYITFAKLFPFLQIPLDHSCYESNKFMPIDCASFVGLLISKDVVQTAGLPNKDFFIYNDDVEYSLRIKQHFTMYLITGSLIYHKVPIIQKDSSLKLLRGKLVIININDYWRDYYLFRNLLYTVRKYNKDNVRFYIIFILYLLRITASIILLGDHKIKKLAITWSTFIDGYLGRFNNTVHLKKYKPGLCRSK